MLTTAIISNESVGDKELTKLADKIKYLDECAKLISEEPQDSMQVDAQRAAEFKSFVLKIEAEIKTVKDPFRLAMCHAFLANLHEKCIETFLITYPEKNITEWLTKYIHHHINAITNIEKISHIDEDTTKFLAFITMNSHKSLNLAVKCLSFTNTILLSEQDKSNLVKIHEKYNKMQKKLFEGNNSKNGTFHQRGVYQFFKPSTAAGAASVVFSISGLSSLAGRAIGALGGTIMDALTKACCKSSKRVRR